VTKFFFDENKYSPADLTDLRSGMVKNATFAVLAVRHGFHTFLKHASPSLSYSLDKFIRQQNDSGHQILDDVSLFLQNNIHENSPVSSKDHSFHQYSVLDSGVACDVEYPKVLSDIFESVAGAILIDSGMALDAVWKSYYPFLHPELGKCFCDPIT
jgi:endoribonuclease Dicer